MKQIILLLLFATSVVLNVKAQNASDLKGEVTLEMADGTRIRGWNRTNFKNIVKFIEISQDAKGERIRYDNNQLERVVFDSGETFVQREINPKITGKKSEIRWVLQEYVGDGIALYSAYIEGQEMTNNRSRMVAQRNYYIAIGNDPAIYVTTDWYSGGMINVGSYNRVQLNYYFTKRYPQYADFAKRIKAKEFETKTSPIEIIKAWEEVYAGK